MTGNRSTTTIPSRVRRHLGRRSVAALATLMLTATGVGTAMAATQVTVKNPGGIVAVGPVNAETGFPAWYQDSAGTRVELCLDGTNPLCGFLPGDIPDETQPISFPGNFPEEAFYMLADSGLDLPGGGTVTLTLGLEAAFANTVTQGDQVVFGRQRIVVKGGPADTTLTFKHPYGEVTIDTDGSGAGKLVEDISPATGNFETPLKSNIGPFLKWDPATAPAAPDGFLGNPDLAHTVTGSPTGYNQFSVTSPAGLNVSNDQFTVMGKVSTNRGVKADSAVLNGNMIDVFATSEGSQIEVEGQPGKFETTPMLTDPGSNRFYARIAFTGDAPTDVRVINIGDKPTSSSTIAVTKPSGINITQASYDGTNLTVAASSANGYPLTVVGVGDLASDQPTAFPVKAPPSSITVKHASGASATETVNVTAGDASPAGLPPIAPAPDPGPVTDTGGGTGTTDPGTPVATTAVASPATVTVARGGTTQLDGSGSTGAAGYQWSQVSGTPVTLTGADTAKPTVAVPYFAKTTDTAPIAANNQPVKLQLVVTDADGVASAPATVDLTIQDDTVQVDTGSRHRLNTELRISGTAVLQGNTAVLVPATSVVIYDTTPGRPVTKLGTATVDTLGAWQFKQKPGPREQITSVRVQSTRGGDATGSVSSR
jgi:hypothetical protein